MMDVPQKTTPAEAKSFVVHTTLKSIVSFLRDYWSNASRDTSLEREKTVVYLLDAVSSVCEYLPASVSVLPELDDELLAAFGCFCAAHPEAARRYPDVGGGIVKDMLEQRTLPELRTIACTAKVTGTWGLEDKNNVIQALLDSGKPLHGEETKPLFLFFKHLYRMYKLKC